MLPIYDQKVSALQARKFQIHIDTNLLFMETEKELSRSVSQFKIYAELD